MRHPRLPELGLVLQGDPRQPYHCGNWTSDQTCVNAFTLPYCAYTSTNNTCLPRHRRLPAPGGLLGSPEYGADVYSNTWVQARRVGRRLHLQHQRPRPAAGPVRESREEEHQGVAANKFECGPHLVLGSHLAEEDDRGFGRFGEIIATAERRPEWVVPTRTSTSPTACGAVPQRGGQEGRVRQDRDVRGGRPAPFELGDRVALGLRATPAPRGARAGGQPLALSEAGEFLLPHDAARRLSGPCRRVPQHR